MSKLKFEREKKRERKKLSPKIGGPFVQRSFYGEMCERKGLISVRGLVSYRWVPLRSLLVGVCVCGCVCVCVFRLDAPVSPTLFLAFQILLLLIPDVPTEPRDCCPAN